MTVDKLLVLKEIKAYYKFESDADYARFLGIKPQTLSNWYSRKTFDWDVIYTKCEGVNIEKIIKEGIAEEYHNKKGTSEPHLIPLYDTVTAAGLSSVDMSPITHATEYIDAGDWFRDATAAMRVHGDSMHPVYKSGSIVALKEVKNKDLVMFGQDYVIETEEYRTLKRIQKGYDKTEWLACSYNEERWEDNSKTGRLIHEPFNVKIDYVNRLFLVLGSVRRNHSSRIIQNSH